MKIDQYLLKLESLIPQLEISNEKVSKANMGWQIEHSFRVIIGVCKTLKASDPKAYTSKFNLKREAILALGKFPRGKARAPKSTRPEGEITEEKLKKLLALARTEITQIQDLHSDAFFHHPLFGNLNLKKAKRFIELHTNHHLKIMDDILG